MIYTVLPTGSFHGWGVCGKYLVKELSKLTEVKLITSDIVFSDILDELDYRFLTSKLISDQENEEFKRNITTFIKYPMLKAIDGKTLQPWLVSLKGIPTIGYTFFEENILEQSYIENGLRNFDMIATGSTWCEEILRSYGLKNVQTILQGIDPKIFNGIYPEKEYLGDKFVIFSGGKFEFRKGQDIVIRAYKVLQEKYKDVLLINSWFNYLPDSFNTMRISSYIKFAPASTDYISMINQLFYDNGIDVHRVITLPPYPNIMMSRIYKNSDIGLFPNRCEGGTNLVLMEYMACGKPVLASYNSGHKDILTDNNSIKIKEMKAVTVANNNMPTAVWEEPSLDETIEKLEWAYNNRDSIKEIGNKAGDDLSKMTWGKTAQCFFELLKP
jgi:glycosyltransferase involved in cell wall biosynthesis